MFTWVIHWLLAFILDFVGISKYSLIIWENNINLQILMSFPEEAHGGSSWVTWGWKQLKIPAVILASLGYKVSKMMILQEVTGVIQLCQFRLTLDLNFLLMQE